MGVELCEISPQKWPETTSTINAEFGCHTSENGGSDKPFCFFFVRRTWWNSWSPSWVVTSNVYILQAMIRLAHQRFGLFWFGMVRFCWRSLHNKMDGHDFWRFLSIRHNLEFNDNIVTWSWGPDDSFHNKTWQILLCHIIMTSFDVICWAVRTPRWHETTPFRIVATPCDRYLSTHVHRPASPPAISLVNFAI